ncbi:hypothetical protein [uncultured Dokdonia sp.]|uniref:toxin-antitoxin system YwqK family antitoxin n=1 Tax=uncultured Dokdonia sp. TaxID=575653 RepID=UPI00260EABD5|nr:hypothetical protein [uncultured Dokdonia sp.]
MTAKGFIIFIFTTQLLFIAEPNSYHKEYHNNGTIKAEGWVMGEQKIKYWKFYHSNGELMSQGHYANNLKTDYWYFYNSQGKLVREGHYEQGKAQNWWIFYDIARQETRKTQYVNNEQEGFCLVYKNNKLIKVEKYEANQLKGEWTSVRAFRRDNPDISFY